MRNRTTPITNTSWVMLAIILFASFIAFTNFLNGDLWSLLASNTDTGTTASPSGLELVTSNGLDELSLLRGCSPDQILKRQNNGNWACSEDATTEATGAGVVTLDLGDDGLNEADNLGEIATTGDTNNIFTEPSTDKLLIDVSQAWPTADALAANGANCSAGNYPLGVDATGAVESCTADDDQPDNDSEVPDAITVNNSASGSITLEQGAAPGQTAEGRIQWDSDDDRIVVGTGSGTATFHSGAHTVDTGPSPDCAGTTTYQDGEGNCDTLDGLEDFEAATDDGLAVGNGSTFDTKVVPDCPDSSGNHLNYNNTTNAFSCGTSSSVTDTNANTICAGSTTYLDGEGNCDDIAPVYVNATGDTMTGALDMDNQSAVKFFELDANGANAFTLAATGSLTGDYSAFWNLTGNCAGNANGGALTINSANEIVCSDDDGGAGGSGDVTDVGDCTTGACFTEDGAGNTLYFEGATANAFEHIVTAADPTADRTFTFPDDQIADDDLLVGSGAGTFGYAALADCDDSGGNHLNYDTTANAFSCGTSNSGINAEENNTGAVTGSAVFDFQDPFDVTNDGGEADISIDFTEVTNTTFGAGSNFTWTFDNVVDVLLTFGSQLLTVLGHVLLDNESELRWGEADANGSNYIAVKAPAAVTSNQTCTLENDSTPFDSCVTVNANTLDVFEIIATDLGSSPRADEPEDTLTLTSPNATISVTGNSTTDTVEFDAVDIVCTDCLNATEIEDIYLLNSGDAGTGAYDFGGADSVEMPNGTAPTVDAAGEIAIDTTDDQLIVHTGTEARVYPSVTERSFALENPADADRLLLKNYFTYGVTVTDIKCIVDPADTGESVVIALYESDSSGDFTDLGTNGLDGATTITCDNDGAEDDGALSNGTIDAGDWIGIDVGTVTGTVTWLTVTWVEKATRE